MYELSRVRLHSVGPKGARYQDVTLDLRDVGKPVTHPVQTSLLDPSTLALPRRPSPASVLFTENGSGKSVLMKLIFSVMLPGRRQVVGTTSSRVLENFVLDTDVAQVALEWQHTGTGERVVTGKVSAWRGHVVSADPNRLTEAWYSFHPTAGFTLDTLPLTEDGRLVSLTGFRERLAEANKVDPGLQLVWENNHGAWTEHLEGLDLDPTLFVYQRRMNAGEGEAAEAFSFASDEAFVDWLLRSVTDEEDPRDLAEVVEGYAATLAQRGALSAEREFIAGALERLTALAATAREHRAAAEQASIAGQGAVAFGSAIRLRHREETARLDSLAELATGLDEAEQQADDEQRRLGAVVLELTRLVAGLKLSEAEAVRDRIVAERDAAKDHLAGWHATGTLLRFRQTQQAAESLRQFVGEKEADAAPILAERDRAAQRLIRGLIGLAERADRLAQQASDSAAGLDEQIDQAGREDREHALLAERRRGAAETARGKLAKAKVVLDELVAEGLLGSGAQLTAAAAQAQTRAEEVAREVRDAEVQQRSLAAERKTSDVALLQAERAARELEHDARIAAERHERAGRDAGGLGAQPRLAELLGADDVTLETDGRALAARLAEAITEAETEQTALRMAAATDQKVIDALGTGGLLPPSEDVIAACDALLGVGIACSPGWEYLARIPDGERQQVIRTHPQLIDGVVLNSPANLDRARRVLNDARLLPRSVLTIGSSASFRAAGSDAGSPVDLSDLEFVVPPNPAMYDGDLAEAERQSLLALQGRRDGRLAELERQIGLDRRLGDRVEQWLRDYPPGTLAALESTRVGAESAHRAAVEQIALARAKAQTIASTEQDLSDRLPGLREAAQEARRRAERLALVAAEAAQIPQWESEVREATDNARLADRTAAAARVEADRLRRVKEETVRHGDDQKRIAVGCRREIADIPGGESEESGDVPAQPVETLRVAYRAATEAYSAVEVGRDLRAQLEAAEKTEAEARAAIEALKPTAREAAGRLLDTPDGADAPGRSAATERADRAVAELDQQVSRAEGEVGGLRHGYQQLRPQTSIHAGGAHDQAAALAPYGAPTGIEDGEQLISRAEADGAVARRRFDELHQRSTALAAQVADTRAIAEGFESVALSMGDGPSGAGSSVSGSSVSGASVSGASGAGSGSDPDGPDAIAFAGPVDAARTRAKQVRAELSAAQARLAELATEVRRFSSALHKYAADLKFERAESPVRRQILAVEVDLLPTYADEWEAALLPRLRTLTDDLAHIGRHRNQITTRLRGMVTTSLTVLQAAERVSVLPETLGDWAGQKFLKIRFADPDRATLDERLGEVIDEFAAANARGDKTKRDGMTLLLRGVRAAMPKGVRVEMLKPDASERAERVRIAQVSDVFSGGQLLTAAIILYCTMAALRANERGQTRRPHAGVLFLDNPIGRASAGYLLELQLGVADALGVQLIYTTGLFDVNALSVFPLIVRLRNDRDIRSGMRFLTVDDEIRTSLDALGAPDGTGQLTAARLFRRPLAIPAETVEAVPESVAAGD